MAKYNTFQRAIGQDGFGFGYFCLKTKHFSSSLLKYKFYATFLHNQLEPLFPIGSSNFSCDHK